MTVKTNHNVDFLNQNVNKKCIYQIIIYNACQYNIIMYIA